MDRWNWLWVGWLVIFLVIEFAAVKWGKRDDTLTGNVQRYIPKALILLLMVAGLLHFLGVL